MVTSHGGPADLCGVIDFLEALDHERAANVRSMCEMISVSQESVLGQLILESPLSISNTTLETHLMSVDAILENRDVRRNLNDWPFEYFWTNPNEPRHSKYLGYFLGSDNKHGCAPILLKQFARTIGPLSAEIQQLFTGEEECNVRTETRNEDGQVDLWLSHQSDEKRFVIIIENKINGARNQTKQLQRYVSRARREGFTGEGQVFVIFLPLIDDCDPDKDDLRAIQGHAKYYKITFEQLVVPWIRALLDEQPEKIDQDLKEHLRYYGRLLEFLIRQRRLYMMNTEILQKLKHNTENNIPLPKFSDASRLARDAQELERTLMQVLRGRLFFAVKAILDERGESVFMSEENYPKQIAPIDEFDPLFAKGVSLSVQTGRKANVCFGWKADDDAWFGVMNEGGAVEEDNVVGKKLKNALSSWKNKDVEFSGGNAWYLWFYRSGLSQESFELTYENAVAPETAMRVANILLEIKRVVTAALP